MNLKPFVIFSVDLLVFAVVYGKQKQLNNLGTLFDLISSRLERELRQLRCCENRCPARSLGFGATCN